MGESRVIQDVIPEVFDDIMADCDGWKVVEDRIVDHRRWEVTHRAVLRDPAGMYWAVKYATPATESQEHVHPDTYRLHPVSAVSKTTTVYE